MATFGQWRPMSIERIRQAAADVKRRHEEAAARRRAENDKEASFVRFREQWMSVYPSNVHFDSEEFIGGVTSHLMALGKGMRERHWDFHLVHYLRKDDVRENYLWAATILQVAATGDELSLREHVVAAAILMNAIIVAHLDFHEILHVRTLEYGTPYTPPLTLGELSNLAGISYHKLNGQRKKKTKIKWETLDGKSERFRRWRSTNEELQLKILAACRHQKWQHIFTRITWSIVQKVGQNR